MNRSLFERSFPNEFFLSIDDIPTLLDYLREWNLLDNDEDIVSASPPGQGNMNCVVRVVTNKQRSFIVKQSRPWVEKYPSIAAPRDRIIGEARFYQAVAATQRAAARMPRLLLCDEKACVMVLEDLGSAKDFTTIYREDELLDDQTVSELCDWLSTLHTIDADQDAFTNLEMRRLNHEHIFAFPLNPANGLPLDEFAPGLSAIAQQLQKDAAYVAEVTRLGEVYLGNLPSTLNCLLHGDFYPGSWLETGDNSSAQHSGDLRIIDPEFSFCGPPEFDVGVLMGHLHLSNQPVRTVESVRSFYTPSSGFDWRLANQFAGVEIMRRLIGVAQLPLTASLETKQRLLETSRRLVLENP